MTIDEINYKASKGLISNAEVETFAENYNRTQLCSYVQIIEREGYLQLKHRTLKDPKRFCFKEIRTGLEEDLKFYESKGFTEKANEIRQLLEELK